MERKHRKEEQTMAQYLFWALEEYIDPEDEDAKPAQRAINAALYIMESDQFHDLVKNAFDATGE